MMEAAVLRDLKRLCTESSGPSRELDVGIAVAVDWRPGDWEEGERTAREMAEKHGIDWLVSRSTDGIASIWRHIPRFTASRDASISLLSNGKRRIEFGTDEGGGRAWAYAWTLQPKEGVGEAEDCRTEELALCAAVLEALAATQEVTA